jgi:SAM-dependent methyltransferase
MHDDPSDDAVIGRLERERERAERRYVAALAALDAASTPPASLQASTSASERDVARLNQIWRESGTGGGFLARLSTELGRLLPWRRRALHGAMIAAINRQADATRDLIDATRHFQSHLIWYAQTIAGFTLTQRRGIDNVKGVEAVHAAVNAMAADWQLRWDALQSRDQRADARVAALTRAFDEARETSAMAQQTAASLRRTVEALSAGPPAGASDSGISAPSPGAGSAEPGAFGYVAFEDRFRGSQDEIRSRLATYVPLFAGASNVLDVGCGRGEMLDLLRDAGVSARGIDVNDDMVERCRARGLTADRADALTFVSALPESSLGGVSAIQVVEHLEPSYLIRFIDSCHRALKPGAPLVLETINAACWAAFFDSYIRDFTHAKPLHPDTLRFLVQARGFARVELDFRAPFADQDRLPIVPLPPPRAGDAGRDLDLSDLAEALNGHAERLNARLFTHRDYAIIARK